ncbi:RidA family protein [Serratia ficaria]|uniref:RidA family protein n=1 Tax=Serratia ficaria TaxID=61651 RepID=UPI000BA3B471|nr:RidA family protein [Serratia ficaria]REF42006.1 2-iminobutanoate/2-iminopropanoate deaminase [Serratia ficaria]
MKRITTASGGPAVVGPYSQAVISGNLVFTAGQIPIIPGTETQPETFKQQVRQTLLNLEAALHAAGSDFDHVIKVNGYLTNPLQLQPYNEVYQELLGHAPPARTTVCVTLWGALEIDCIAELITVERQ